MRGLFYKWKFTKNNVILTLNINLECLDIYSYTVYILCLIEGSWLDSSRLFALSMLSRLHFVTVVRCFPQALGLGVDVVRLTGAGDHCVSITGPRWNKTFKLCIALLRSGHKSEVKTYDCDHLCPFPQIVPDDRAEPQHPHPVRQISVMSAV